MSDATDRIPLGRKHLVDAYTQQHESDAVAARAYAEDILGSAKSSKKSKEGAMSEHIPTPLTAKRVVPKDEELWRKREGKWDATTMVGETSPEGAALRALQRASAEKVTAAQETAAERLENETPLHAATSETEGPKIETTPLAAPDRKPGRSGSSQLEKQKLPATSSKSARKLSPELMRVVLDALRECPILWIAARKAGIHRKTLEYRIKRSEAGDDGCDIEWQGITQRFHEHCESAIDEAHQKVEDEWLRRAFDGYEKVLTRRGRVVYKIDQELVRLGFQGPDAYLRDENGKPVPETIHQEDTKAQLRVLKRRRPKTWGKRRKIDAAREGGVLVIGGVTKKPKYNTDKSVRARKWKADSRRLREEKD